MKSSVLFAAATLLLVACGGPLTYDLRGSQISPGSDAHVVAAVDKDRHVTEVEVAAQNLTPPDRLVDGGKGYVVWSRKDSGAAWQRVGGLEMRGGGREGKAKFTVPEVAFDLLISAEADQSAASPSGKAIFEQKVNR